MMDPDNFVGSMIGSYQLVEFIGEGGMAKVYRALHSELQRYAAIKVMHAHYSQDDEFVRRFKNEAKNLALLRHPNIVQVYDASINGQFPYIVMEYIRGKTLKEFIQEYNNRQARIPIMNALRITYSIGLALAFAHQNQVVHRDVKPGNVILEESGRIVLTDFGLAQLGEEEDRRKKEVEGTPAYISPEQALGRATDPRADQYSLGVIFYELLTGRKPYETEDPVTMTISHVTNEVPSPQEYVPEIPDEVAEIVVRATQRNPGKRYDSMNEFLSQLTKVRIKTKTAKLPTASLKDLKLSSDRVASWAPPDMKLGKDDAYVSLHFVDTGQVMDLGINREYLIGRGHQSQPILPDIDLTPFSAYEWGISRLHASLTIKNNEVVIADLG
ncbi:MAG TPA: FHA domain-containing serine/threonine-protein kinase, partial [Anaerolineales bacterium]|nr:FHA domain-containing serine/threonine-protein kinase [Anaerolineales bacterium]